eukprot:gene30128-biopygen31393
MCRVCAGIEVGLTCMVRCGTCWLVSAGWRPGNEALVRLVTEMLALRTRPSTDRVHQRGVRDITFFLGHFCGTTLPATAEDVLGYCGYAVELREYRLDSSSSCGLVDSAGERCLVPNPCHAKPVLVLLVVLDKNYKRPSQAKCCWTLVQWVTIRRYLRVFYRLRRVGAGVAIEFFSPPDLSVPHVVVVRGDEDLAPYVRGRLEKDKNVNARKPRYFYMPEHIPGLDISPVSMLEEYIIREGVPSGGLLFLAPKGATGWYPGPYTGHGRAFVRAYRRAYPDAEDHRCYGGGSARKSLGQWLDICGWASGWGSRMISDVGGGVVERAVELVKKMYGDCDVPIVSMTFDGVTVYDPLRMARNTDLQDYDSDTDHVLSDYSDESSDEDLSD